VESEAWRVLPTLRYALQELRRWCRTSQTLPYSCRITHDIQLVSPHVISYSALSDIYRGTYNGVTVAVKSLRIHMDNVDVVKKVCMTEVTLGRADLMGVVLCSPSVVRPSHGSTCGTNT
jgi:hypothetical protein